MNHAHEPSDPAPGTSAEPAAMTPAGSPAEPPPGTPAGTPAPPPEPDTTPVRTESGLVAGHTRPGVLTFRGIPYAAAPEADLAFAAPQRHPGWEGVRPAVSNGPTPTLGPMADNHSIPEHPVPGSERLNVNVFTPAADSEAKLPVYVWIHGGGYVGGAPGGPWFDGATFARRGIVTVTMTYRLGFEGFGHIPGAPDNRGVLDQIAALQWVQRNIAAFGGDPGRVTLGGQSAGAGSVLALLAARATQGLFSQAISHSAPLPDLTPEAAEALGRSLAKSLGIEHTTAGWAALTREQVVQAERGLLAGGLLAGLKALNRLLREREPVTWFGPVLGADPLGPDVLADLAGADDRRLLLGATSNEFNHLADQVQARLARSITPTLLGGLGMPATRARAYPAAFPGLNGTQLVGQAITDRVFRYPVVRVGAARAQAEAPTWAWDFRWRSPVTGLSTHCLDLPFAWHALDAERVARATGEDPPVALAQDVHSAISAFITDGDPGWAPFTTTDPVARVFDTESWTGADPYRFERIAVQVER